MDGIQAAFMTPNYTRLQTFYSSPLPSNLPFSNSPMKLAEAGFSRTQEAIADEVGCSFCGVKYKGWSGESPLAVHRTLNPNCFFLNTPPNNVQDNLSLNGHGNHRNELESVRRQLFPESEDSFPSISSIADIEHPFLPKRGGYLMLFESHRLLTYNDPLSADAACYAKGGFMYSVSSESVFCVYCDVELDFHSTHMSLLNSRHTESSSLCPFVRLFDVGNISRDMERKIREKVRAQHLNDALNNRISLQKLQFVIKHPEYEDEAARVGTFSSWPALQASMFPAQIMTDCGFYYTGISDQVKCYSCGVGLYNWLPNAVPVEQHAKASLMCVFLLHTKGKDFVENAQNIELIVKVDQGEMNSQPQEEDAASLTTDSGYSSTSSSPRLPAATPTSASSPASISPGSPVLDLEAIKAAMAYGQYPNTDLLLGTLKAADENYVKLCEKSHQVISKEVECQEKEAELQAKEAAYQEEIQAKDSVIEATRTELQATRTELQCNAVDSQWHDLEVRTELEQQFIGQLQQQNEMLQQHREVIEQKDQQLEQKDQELEQHREVIEQKDQVIEHKDVQLEMKNRELADLQRHIRSLVAELDRRQGSCGSDDEESSSSSDVERRPEVQPSPEEFPVANCKVCLVKPSQIVFLPCKHLCCCDGCASRLRGKSCPICRACNLGFEKVYVI